MTPEEIEAAEDAKLDEFLKTRREDNIPTICCRHCGSTEIEPLDPWVWWRNPCRWFVRL